MAKNTKNNLYNVENENNQNKKYKAKKKNKNKKNNKPINEEKFSFDNEIIIGVKKMDNENKEEVSSKSKKKKNKKYKKNKNKSNKDNNILKKKKKNEKIEINSEIELDELRELRIEKTRRKIKILKYLMLFILSIVIILLVLFSPLFNVKNILVEGNQKISTEQIISLSKIEIDTNTFKLSSKSIRENIMENTYIEDVELVRDLPSTVVLKIKERLPQYLIEYADGYVVIDKKGYILTIIQEKLDLPILQGIETSSEIFLAGNKLDPIDINKIYIVSQILEIAQDNDIGNLITRIDVENINNIKLIFESQEKTAYMGDDSNLTIKVLTIKQILEKTKGLAGEILVDMDLNSEYPIFRERV